MVAGYIAAAAVVASLRASDKDLLGLADDRNTVESGGKLSGRAYGVALSEARRQVYARRHPQAAAAFRRAASLNPRAAAPPYELGRLLLQDGRHLQEAESELKQAARAYTTTCRWSQIDLSCQMSFELHIIVSIVSITRTRKPL